MDTARAWVMTPPPAGDTLWTWTPAGLEELATVRRVFRATLTGDVLPGPALSADRVEESVLALDELMSNGLRHGRPPVHVEVRAADAGLLLLVSDRAAGSPLMPTSTRDPSLGGMGLGMVAHVATACGWVPQDDVKTVWALMPTAPR
ncbi:MAG: putative signal transduction histidine kinase [Klenkia sp.]|nr:putative signal transduction histidine kinase [Klenkia sp.]